MYCNRYFASHCFIRDNDGNELDFAYSLHLIIKIPQHPVVSSNFHGVLFDIFAHFAFIFIPLHSHSLPVCLSAPADRLVLFVNFVSI